MHILLTDLLTCPRCGPDFGLIVLADALADRRIREGRLGCANCREAYSIHGGVADLRVPPASAPPPAPPPAASDPERALRIAALLGVGHAPGLVLLLTRDADLVPEIDALLPNARVLGSGPDLPEPGGAPAAEWLLHGPALPFRSHSLRGLALLAGDPLASLGEARRVLARGARLVVEPAPAGMAEALAAEGWEVLLVQEGVVVASGPGPG